MIQTILIRAIESERRQSESLFQLHSPSRQHLDSVAVRVTRHRFRLIHRWALSRFAPRLSSVMIDQADVHNDASGVT